MMDLLLQQFLGQIQNNGSKVELISFFKTVLTPKELAQLPKRLEVLKQLNSGIRQRDIAKNLNVSIGMVTRGSNAMKILEEKKPDWWEKFKKFT